MLSALIVVWFLVSLCHSALPEIPTKYTELNTTFGTIRGFTEKVKGKDVDIFLGIPYAEPPIEEKRFSRPTPLEPLSGLYDATKFPNSCSQVMDNSYGDFEGSQMWNPNTNISEDCLYLNIWAPRASNSNLKAVIIWIFGGGFYAGSSTLDIYDGRILASVGDVIVVSMQYRLGVMGFLYLDNSEAPGNMGLLDQYVALLWVNKYIEDFGGDKTKVTLFGESAGASSSALHLLSPLSKPLVNNVILQSSSSLASWAVDTQTTAKTKAYRLAQKVNCAGNDKEIVQCLKSIDAHLLSEVMWEVRDKSHISTPFTPTIDYHFLHDFPRNLIKDGQFKHADALLGFNKNEGNFYLIYEGYIDVNNSKDISKSRYTDVISQILHTNNSALNNLVAYAYESNGYKYNPDYIGYLDGVLGDVCFVCPTIDFAEYYAEAGNDVYMYYFTHRTSGNPWPAWTGVMHGYEIDHVFGVPLNDSLSLYETAEKELSQKMVTYWTNFAKSSNPNKGYEYDVSPTTSLPVWPLYTVEEKSALVLKTGDMKTILGPKERECRFWRDIYPPLKETIDLHYELINSASSARVWKLILFLPAILMSTFLLS